jgi:hypothetical protein
MGLAKQRDTVMVTHRVSSMAAFLTIRQRCKVRRGRPDRQVVVGSFPVVIVLRYTSVA